MFWPKFDVVSLRKTPAKVSFTPTFVAPVAEIHEVAEIDDDDSESDDFYCCPAVELFPEDQEHSLNFIVEGCTFRGDIEIPTPPPFDAEQEDAYQIMMVVLGRMSEFPVLRISVSSLLLRSPDQGVRSRVALLRLTSSTVTWLSRSDQSLCRFCQLRRRLHLHRNLRRELLRPVLPVLRVLSLPPTVLLDD
jgi:hypothetical protein